MLKKSWYPIVALLVKSLLLVAIYWAFLRSFMLRISKYIADTLRPGMHDEIPRALVEVLMIFALVFAGGIILHQQYLIDKGKIQSKTKSSYSSKNHDQI